MKRFIVGSTWDRTNRNGINNNFDYLFDGVATMNNLSIKADATLLKADAVLLNAENINNSNVDVQNQLDNIILESGTSDAEVVQSRTDYNGNTFPLLKDRLNNTDKSILSRGANVIDFGAVGDGVTDDTQAFKDAIASGYKTVYAPNKTFLITETINIEDNNIAVFFEGELTFNNNDVCISVTGDDNVIELNINGLNKARVGIDVIGKNNVIINSNVKNIYSDNDSALGVNVANNGYNKVINCKIENIKSEGNSIAGDSNGASRAIRVVGLSINDGETLLKDNTLIDVGGEEGDSIHLIAPLKNKMIVRVIGNHIKTFSRRAIKIQCSNTEITGNLIENYTEHPSLIRAIDIQGVDNTTIFNNHFKIQYVSCIGVAGQDGKKVINTKILNNKIESLTDHSIIYTTQVESLEFKDNSIFKGGPLIFNDIKNCKVVNNIIDSLLIDDTRYPMSFMQSGDNTTIMGNIITGTSYYRPLRSNSTNVRIIGNVFTDFVGGIEVSSTGNGIVANNIVKAQNVISTPGENYQVENNTLVN